MELYIAMCWTQWRIDTSASQLLQQVNGGDTQSRNVRKKLAQVSCASFLHQIFVQVYASAADDTSNKKA